MQAAYQGYFPPDSQFPSEDDLVEEWNEALADEQAACWLATIDGVPVGTVATRYDAHPGQGEIRKLYVDPDWWGRGIGARLFDTAIEHLQAAGHRRIAIWVLEINEPARRWYEKRGWRLVPGVTKAPFGSTEVRYHLDTTEGGLT